MHQVICSTDGGDHFAVHTIVCACLYPQGYTWLLCYITFEKWVLCNYAVCITQNTTLKRSKRQMAMNNLWRHQDTFDSQTITMIGITVFSDRKIIFSILKTFLKTFEHGQGIEE